MALFSPVISGMVREVPASLSGCLTIAEQLLKSGGA